MVNLRELAEADLAVTLEDAADGFGWPITVTDPDGTSAALTGQSGDVSELIDPDTGQAVSGRFAHVSLRLSSLYAAGLGMPKGIAESGRKPWRIAFPDINGVAYLFEVRHSKPDRTMGVVTCTLGGFKNAA